MYTSTMTPDELANEFSKDFEETALFYDAKRKQVNKLLKNREYFLFILRHLSSQKEVITGLFSYMERIISRPLMIVMLLFFPTSIAVQEGMQ